MGEAVDEKIEKAEAPAETPAARPKPTADQLKDNFSGAGSKGSKDAPVRADYDGVDAEVSKDGQAGDNKDNQKDKAKQSGGNTDVSKDQSDEDIQSTSSARENKAHAAKSVG